MMRRTALIASIVTASLIGLAPLSLADSTTESASASTPPEFTSIDGHSNAGDATMKAPAADKAPAAAKEVSAAALKRPRRLKSPLQKRCRWLPSHSTATWKMSKRRCSS